MMLSRIGSISFISQFFPLLLRSQYETVPDIPVQVLDDLFLELIGGDKYLKLNPNQEQDLLDLLEECAVMI